LMNTMKHSFGDGRWATRLITCIPGMGLQA